MKARPGMAPWNLRRDTRPRWPPILAQRDPGQASDPQNQKKRTRCCSKPLEGGDSPPDADARGGREGGREARGQLPLVGHAPACRASPSVRDQLFGAWTED